MKLNVSIIIQLAPRNFALCERFHLIHGYETLEFALTTLQLDLGCFFRLSSVSEFL